MPFSSTWMEIAVIILSEVSQRERKVSYDITYMWNLKHDTNEFTYKQKQTHRCTEQAYGRQGREWVGEGWTGSLGLADANY